jgi:hypothetical protein
MALDDDKKIELRKMCYANLMISCTVECLLKRKLSKTENSIKLQKFDCSILSLRNIFWIWNYATYLTF